MLTVSDNTATDVLIADLGGIAAVQRWLDSNRVAGVRIDGGLSGRRACRTRQRQREKIRPDHAAAPVAGRTLKTWNMPACMW